MCSKRVLLLGLVLILLGCGKSRVPHTEDAGTPVAVTPPAPAPEPEPVRTPARRAPKPPPSVVVPPGTRFDVTGKVEVREGSCQPPAPPCTIRPAARKIRVRTAVPDAIGPEVTTTWSGPDGRYRLRLEPGVYMIAVLAADGAADDPNGGSFIRVIDKPVISDMLINNGID